MDLSAQAAERMIRSGRVAGPIRVKGRLDLNKFEGECLPAGLHCYELDVTGSPHLPGLPADLRVTGRLVLNDCPAMVSLPPGLTVGSLSLRNCTSLTTLPEGLSTWFLDLANCHQFEHWPSQGRIDHGSLLLRNCARVATLPRWLGRLAQLDLAGCVSLKELPEGISVTSWLDVGGAGLMGLPPSLRGAALRWRGVRINERVAFHPEQLTAKEALDERNAEVRRVMIERMGYSRFAREANARLLDKDRDPGGLRQLLHIELKEDEPLVCLSCFCPSTSRQYFLRVPPNTRTCHQAAAWIAGFDDPDLYHPTLET